MAKHWWHDSKTHTAIFALVMSAALLAGGIGMLYSSAHFLGQDKQVVKELTPVDLPARIMIPKISVDTNVQMVGTTTSGRMGIPDNFTDVAWFTGGPRPGERGSANISGHLDTATDTNAVFINLDQLIIGDEIYILDKGEQSIKFKVTAIEVYDETNAPLARIFDTSGTTARLNLITCDGAWDQGTKNYSKRLVVYSERILD
ncbi:MAG: class F sortase [Patescibacteria group bacterium]